MTFLISYDSDSASVDRSWLSNKSARVIFCRANKPIASCLAKDNSEIFVDSVAYFRITEPIIRHLAVTFEGDLDKLIAKQQETAAQASRRDSRQVRKEPEPLPDVISEDENNKESEE